MRRSLALATAAATALLLTACSGGDDAAEPEAGAGSSASADAPAEDAGDDAPAGGGDEECVLGTWDVDTDAMAQSMQELLGGAEVGDMQMTLDGTMSYEFAEGGTFTATSDMTSGVTMSAEGMEMVTDSTSEGTMTGSWAVAGDQLTLSDLDTSGLTVTTSGTVNGEPLEIPEGSTEGMMAAAPPTTSTITCTDDTLTLVTTSEAVEGVEPISSEITLRR
ncbi:hypothetical protein [Cellulomonas sp.]|uniref:hypothetical protein n=1 Tax=Cellulomonas sp. TaxID=40001 RepID=UPI00281202BB|nr:hypothetical protein [Cellulomonas sp.]